MEMTFTLEVLSHGDDFVAAAENLRLVQHVKMLKRKLVFAA